MLTDRRGTTIHHEKGMTNNILTAELCHQSTAIVQDDSNQITAMSNKVMQKRWKCDICRIKWFLNFKEAVAHEKKCNGAPAMIKDNSRDASSKSETTSSNHASIPNEMKKSPKKVFIDLDGSDHEMEKLPKSPSSGSFSKLQKKASIEVTGNTYTEVSGESNEKVAAGIMDVDDERKGVVDSKPSGTDGDDVAIKDENSNDESIDTFGRRKSKRLREVVQSKPPTPEKTSTESVGHNIKLKKSKTNKSDQLTITKNKTTEKTGKLNAFFRPKKALQKQETISVESDDEESFVLGKEDYANHVAAEKFFSSKKRAAENVARKKKKQFVEKKGKSKEFDIAKVDSEEAEVVDKLGSSCLAKASKKKKALSKEVLAEHQAADFFARRKQAAAEERERQKRRDELRKARMGEKNKSVDDEIVDSRSTISSLSNQAAPTLDSNSAVSSQLTSCKFSKRKKENLQYPPVIKFPFPSHVVPPEESEDIALSASVSSASIRQTPKFQYPQPTSITPSAPDAENHHVHPISFFKGTDDSMVDLERDSAKEVLSSVFSPTDSKDRSNDLDNQLWTQKYSMTRIPDDVLGSENQESAKKLVGFVEDWKVRRHKSLQALAAQAKQSRRKKKKKRGSCGYASDDSFLDDGGLESIFLITGPTGSGKTRLVHAVAEQCACAVMEINSAEQRGGQALKRALQESTQCHSSIALMNLARPNLFEVSACAGSDMSDESDSGDDSDREEDSSSGRLTIILIDEVDLLFEDDGDVGFWAALAQLSQKAKCPIVLTSSSVPAELEYGNATRFKSIALQRPTVDECCNKIRQVSRSEGMTLRKSDEDEASRLSLVAEIFNCDLRKIINELQLFNSAPLRGDKSNIIKTISHTASQRNSDNTILTDGKDRPVIFGITPALVPRDSSTLITIDGENFDWSASIELYIGGEICRHFSVVNDNKILAVCPPCILPEGVTKTAKYEDCMHDCLSRKFAEVVIRKRCPNGLILDSNSGHPIELDQDGHESSHRTTWNIEYNIPLEETLFDESRATFRSIQIARAQERIQKKISEDMVESDSENDFEMIDSSVEKKPLKILKKIQDTPVPFQKREAKVENINPEVMLNEAVLRVKPEENLLVNEITSSAFGDISKKCHQDQLELDCFAADMGRLSDMALLEDSFTHLIVPFLSGAVEGLGVCASEYQEVADDSIDKLCKGKNNRPPSFESLYTTGENESGLFFGCSDSYVTYPNRRRDRYVLSLSESHSRGLGFMDSYSTQESLDKDSNSSSSDDDVNSVFPTFSSRVCSEDDALCCQQVSPSFLLLPSLLEKGLHYSKKHGFTRYVSPHLQLKTKEMSAKVLGLMHALLAEDTSENWPFGLRHGTDIGDETAQRNLIWIRNSLLNNQLALEYLPHLRKFAFYEKMACLRAKKIMGQDDAVLKTKRTTRRSNRNLRRHYFDEFLPKYHDNVLLESASSDLANCYLG